MNINAEEVMCKNIIVKGRQRQVKRHREIHPRITVASYAARLGLSRQGLFRRYVATRALAQLPA